MVNRFRLVLDQHIGLMDLFDEHAIQVEGWLKGELLAFLNQDKQKGVIRNLYVEVRPDRISRKRIDLQIDVNGKIVWVELKHFQIGRQESLSHKGLLKTKMRDIALSPSVGMTSVWEI